jgi:hypothetical protein
LIAGKKSIHLFYLLFICKIILPILMLRSLRILKYISIFIHKRMI